MELHVALLLPYHDGSGETRVLGVYSIKWKAQARCYRELRDLGYEQPTDVVTCVLDEDLVNHGT